MTSPIQSLSQPSQATAFGTSATFDFSSNLTVGSKVIVCLNTDSTSGYPTSVQVAGSSATVYDSGPGGFEYIAIYWVEIVNSGRTDVVVNYAAGTNRCTLSADEWASANMGASPRDQTDQGSDVSASYAFTMTGTTTQANEIVYFVGSDRNHAGGGGQTLAGYTIGFDYSDTGTTYPSGISGWKEVSATGQQTGTYASNNSFNKAVVMATFKITPTATAASFMGHSIYVNA